ncbi:YkgJ family cysteine cluster protein [Verrucomicrobiota bacterium]
MKQAIPFACTRCGQCCHTHKTGETVVLYEDDIVRICRELMLTPQEFLRTYSRIYEYTYVTADARKLLRRLVLPCEHGCAFLSGGHCRIHEIKPFQCRAWPFLLPTFSWDTGINSSAQFCPGIATGETTAPAIINAFLEDQDARESIYCRQVRDKRTRISRWLNLRPPDRRFEIRRLRDGSATVCQKLRPRLKGGE